MFDLLKPLGLAAAVAVLPLAGSAATWNPADGETLVVASGDTIQFGANTSFEFVSEVNATGGAGSFNLFFDASKAGTGYATLTIGNIVSGLFPGLMMEWVGGPNGAVPATPVETTLATVFTDPGGLMQEFRISWDDSRSGTGFDVEGAVSTVPVPAAGLLLLGALGGLGLARRRRKADAA